MKRNTILKCCVITIGCFLVVACGDNSEKNKQTAAAEKATEQLVPGTPIQYDSSKRYIFLTWDDAPQPPGTEICKAVFHRHGVKATFFAVGAHQFEPRRKRLVDSIRNSYPEFLLANHSYSHGFKNSYTKFYKLADSATRDFIRAEKEMNVQVKIIRLPGNNSWVANGEMKGPKSTMEVCKRLDSLGYCVIGWDLEWGFKKGSIPLQSVEQMVKAVNDKFEDGTTYEQNALVILAHDRMFAKQPYTDSLDKFITTLKKDSRNVFETIDHYPMVQRKMKNEKN